VRGARCGVRRPVPSAWCGVLGAMLGAWCVMLGAVGFTAEATPTAQSPAAQDALLPESEGVQVLRSRCLTCHGADLIASQRLSEAAWGSEIDKMVRWGAAVAATERAPLQAYLARYFAPARAASPADAAAGEAVFKRACLTCHGLDMTEQQRLSPAGWTREVEKMMRWGAQVPDPDKDALVNYLAARYPAR
jgi:cytochrome c5